MSAAEDGRSRGSAAAHASAARSAKVRESVVGALHIGHCRAMAPAACLRTGKPLTQRVHILRTTTTHEAISGKQ